MEIGDKELTMKQLIRVILLVVFGVFIMIVGGAMRGLGSLMILTAVLFWVYKFAVKKLASKFPKNCFG